MDKSQARVASILERFPGPVRFAPVLWIRLIALVPSCIVALHGLVLLVFGNDDGHPIALGLTLFLSWGLISGWLIMDLLPRNRLTLEADRFEFVMWRNRHSYDWHRVANFRAIHDGERDLIVFDVISGDDESDERLAVDGRMEYDELPDLYGLPPDGLVELMAGWRARAVAADPSTVHAHAA